MAINTPKRGGKGHLIGGQGRSIGGQGYRLGGQGKRLDRAPEAPKAPVVGEKLNGKTIASIGGKGFALGGQGKRLPTQGVPTGNNKPATGPTTSKPPPPAPVVDPRDPTYWANVAAIQQQYGQQTSSNMISSAYGTERYNAESERMGTDSARAKRNLAESLLGTGGIRSGSHRRDRTEMDQDYASNRSRLDRDFRENQAQGAIEQQGINDTLGEGGTAYTQEMLGAVDRGVANELSNAESGDPIYKTPGIGHKLQGVNKAIAKNKKALEGIKSPKKREKIAKNIRELKARRDKLRKRRDKKN